MQGGSPHFCLMDVEFRIAKTTAIVQDRHHELQGKITCEVKALIALHRIGGGMPLGKGIACKTLDLLPNIGRQQLVVPFFPTVLKKLSFYGPEFLPGTELTA